MHNDERLDGVADVEEAKAAAVGAVQPRPQLAHRRDRMHGLERRQAADCGRRRRPSMSKARTHMHR